MKNSGEELAELAEEENQRRDVIRETIEEVLEYATELHFEGFPIREEVLVDGDVAPITEADERAYRETHVDEDDVLVEGDEDDEEEE